MVTADEDMLLLDYIMKTRCRIVVFVFSAIGLSILCMVLLLRPSPSLTVAVSPTGPHHKVSVILCRPHATVTEVTSTYNTLKKVLSKINVEHEFFVVSLHLKSSGSSSKLRPHNSYHVLSFKHSCAESAYYALEHSHYSVILYISSNITSYQTTVPKLIRPVLHGSADLALLDDSNKPSPTLWEDFLYLLLMPIIGAAYVSDTPTFAISSGVWFHGCHGIIGGRGSLTVDLVSRCVLRNWIEVDGSTTPPYEESPIQLSQVIDIWWDLHPFIVFLSAILLAVGIILVFIRCSHYCNSPRSSTRNLIV